jgi:hypothetical protein
MAGNVLFSRFAVFIDNQDAEKMYNFATKMKNGVFIIVRTG